MHEANFSRKIGLYRSGVTSIERVRKTSVGREHLLSNAIESVRGCLDKKSKQHLLFIGPRGIGKTHLLTEIEDKLQSDGAFSNAIVIVRFPEESNRILSFADFLIGLCQILKDVVQDEPQWNELLAKVRTEEDNAKVVDTLVPVIRRENRQRKRTVVVMLENLGEVFTKQIRDKNELGALRKFLMADSGCLLIATASLYFDAITNVEEPFYDFFDIQNLENLSFEETQEIIRRNLEWDEHQDILDKFEGLRPRLKALYQMTGGNPRLTMMLYELIAHESINKVQDQFHLLLDRISPFYQSRLNDLAPGQRALLECIASMRDQEKTPASIAAQMRMSHQETSSLLKRLTDAQYLRASEHPQDKRSRLYTIREGFFDIWLAMNLSRSARKRLPFLLEFFELFFPRFEDREKKRKELRNSLNMKDSGDTRLALDYLSEIGEKGEKAVAKFDLAEDMALKGNAQLMSTYVFEAASLAEDGVSRTIANLVRTERFEPNYLSDVAEMIKLWQLHRSGELEQFADRLMGRGDQLALQTFSEVKLAFLLDTLDKIASFEGRIQLRLQIAGMLMELARWGECENQQRRALEEAEELESPVLVASASSDLALLLSNTSRLEEAEYLMRRALELDEVVRGKHHPVVGIRQNGLACILQETGRLDEAEQLFRRALGISETYYGSNHPSVAIRLNNLANLLQHKGHTREAETMSRRALRITQETQGKHHPDVAVRLNNLALLLQETQRHDIAEERLRQALDINKASYGEHHPNVAVSLNNLAGLLRETNRLPEAEILFRQALEIDESSYGENHPMVANRLNNLAQTLALTGKLIEAEPLARRAVEILRSFRALAGREHPQLQLVRENYRRVQQALGSKN